jgi:HipA-like protein
MPVKKFIEIARDWLGRRTVVKAAPGIRATFLLKYGDLIVGTLGVADGVWTFHYSDDFKRDGQLRPLVEFPDVDESYNSAELWQFFAMRIPSAEQPEVEEILRREQILEDDAVGLLKRFGARTIANPFELTLAA